MKIRVLGVLFILAGLYGCAATPEAETAPTDQPEATGAETGGPAAQVSPLDDPNSPLSKKVFYFPYDSSEIDSADRDTLSAHAKFIAANPGVSVVAEGHADERGSREYNLALGERRAQAVQRLLMLQGAAQGQSKVVSYGEERPVATGNDESAWRLNRRVELLYSGY